MAVNITGADVLTFTALSTAGFLSSGGGTTLLVVIKKASDTGLASTLMGLNGASGSAILGIDATNHPSQNNGSTARVPTTMTVTAANGWVCMAVTKAPGTTTPRFHKYVYSTGVASHEDASAGLQAAGSALGATPKIAFAAAVGGANTGPASYAAGAVFDRALSDQEFESAAVSLAAMKASSPGWGLWVFDGGLTEAGESFIGSVLSAGSATSVDTAGSPLGMGFPVDFSQQSVTPPTFSATYNAVTNAVDLVVGNLPAAALSTYVERFTSATLTNGVVVRGSSFAAPLLSGYSFSDREFTPGVQNTYRLHVIS